MRKFYGGVSAIVIIALVFVSTASNAQSTFAKVHQILSANCQGSGCHSGGPNNAQSGLDFSLSDSAVYSLIIGKTPLNPRAAAKGNKIIDPGYPERSFLLRKMAHCNEPDLALEPAEGIPMPQNRAAIADSNFEVIRQWIIKAAPQDGIVVDEALLRAYYGGPHTPRITPPAPPLPCEGIQVHLGPIFFWPGQEMEFLKRYDMKNATDIEVRGLQNIMNNESHHFILRKYNNLNGVTQSLTVFDSMGIVNIGATPFDQNKDYVMAWQNSIDVELPNGTAYKWPANTSIDLNYHVHNFDSVPLAAEVYLNIYTQPAGTATMEMKSALENQAFFTIKAGDTTVLKFNVFNGNNKSIWSITSHTHKYGRGYKVWLKKPNGDKGDLIYDGNYNFDYTFNQGFFDWHHPPTRTFEPLLNMANVQSDGSAVAGLVEEATYISNDSVDRHFGFTTVDEMMIIYIQYVDGAYNIPAQGYHNPKCVQVPYVNPCDVPTNPDTLVVSGGATTGSLGDTITLISNGDTTVVIITGIGGPYTFNNGDRVISSQGGIVYLNGVPVGYSPGVTSGINNVGTAVADFNVYPNPLEGHATIDYLLSEGGTVSLEIYNVMGQRTDVLVDNEKQSSGGRSYQYTPAKTSSGIYFVKLTVNGATTVRKITVL